MTTFHQLCDPEESIWNIHLQFNFADLEDDASPSLARVIQWFQQYPGFEGFPGGIDKQMVPLKNINESSIDAISPEHGMEFLEHTIKEAIHYCSDQRLMPGRAKLIAEAFLTEFEAPLVFCNHSRGTGPYYWGCYTNVTDAEHGYTIEYFLCCIDRKRIGFVFSLNNE